VGLHYRPPFPYAKRALGDVDAWKVLSGDFVDVGEATGIVHMAGAFGEDDLLAVRGAGILIYNPVNASGNFDATVPEYEGTFIKDADDRIIEHLRSTGVLVRSEPHLLSYMHCWRCKSPLFYYALVS